VKSKDKARRAFLLGYVKGRKAMRRELAQQLAQADDNAELRAAMAEWRASVEARRQAETAIVDFWRDIHYQAETGQRLQ
jgi:hypothetical protein